MYTYSLRPTYLLHAAYEITYYCSCIYANTACVMLYLCIFALRILILTYLYLLTIGLPIYCLVQRDNVALVCHRPISEKRCQKINYFLVTFRTWLNEVYGQRFAVARSLAYRFIVFYSNIIRYYCSWYLPSCNWPTDPSWRVGKTKQSTVWSTQSHTLILLHVLLAKLCGIDPYTRLQPVRQSPLIVMIR